MKLKELVVIHSQYFLENGNPNIAYTGTSSTVICEVSNQIGSLTMIVQSTVAITRCDDNMHP